MQGCKQWQGSIQVHNCGTNSGLLPIYYELLFGIKLVPIPMDFPVAGLHLTPAVNSVATFLGVVSLHRGCMTTWAVMTVSPAVQQCQQPQPCFADALNAHRGYSHRI